MPSISRFTNQELPEHYAHQIRDFIRMTWFDIFQYDVHAPAMPDEWQPIYFVIGEEPALFSHAAVVSQTVECNGQIYACGGLSSIFTYPAFRRRGYGSQVVQAATEYIKSSTFDVALLWTDNDKADFYARWGWESPPFIQAHIGPKSAPQPYEAFMMVLFVSERTKADRAAFEGHPLYVGEFAW